MLTFANMVMCIIALGGVSEDGAIINDFVQLDVNSGITVDQLLPLFNSARADSISYVEPGIVPEGDYLFNITFTNDGSKVLVCNYLSHNVTVIDWASMSVDTTLAVEGMPIAIACSDEYMVVSELSVNKVDVFSLSDYSLTASFPVEDQPWVLRISDDGNYAYVACYVDNVCEVIDLVSLTHTVTISNFPLWLTSFGYASENNRLFIRFSGFEPVCGGDYLAAGDGIKDVLFFNTSTGNVDYAVPVSECENVALSGDRAYLVALSDEFPVSLSRIDLSTFTVDRTVSVSGYFPGVTREIAVNQDGSKAFISTNNNSGTLVRFLTNDFVTFADTYSPLWIGVSPDHSLAVCGNDRYSVIDFATETMVAQYQGDTQSFGCVSPAANNTASYDPTTHEGIFFYTFDGSSANYLGDVMSGSSVESDGTRRAAITTDGSIAVVSNTMSDNVSIIDLSTFEVDAVLEIGDRVQDVAITSDSKWAVICGFNSNSVKIIDLETNTIVADVLTGSGSSVVSITPDDGYAYVGNISDNTVSVVQLDGASSIEIAEIPCGVIGLVWSARGVTSDVRVSPDGAYCLVAASFDDKVKVIDTATNTIVADLTVGVFPLQIAFNNDGSRALVSNYNGGTYSLLDINGASSSVVGTWIVGNNPMRVAYDSISDQFAIGLFSNRAVKTVDPSTGSITGTHSYASSGNVIDVDYAVDGSRLVLTEARRTGSFVPCRIHRDSEMENLGADAACFEYCSEIDVALATSPGADYAIYISFTPEGIEESEIVTVDMPGLTVSPNPGNGCFAFNVFLPSACDMLLGVYDLSGRLVSRVEQNSFVSGSYVIDWNDSVPAGVYAVRLDAGEKTVTRLMTVCE
ncbi:MAG: T9SS type A sorting domain-containing protein [Candidatus Aegiribacteria sp.]|nr:T9SS type A sorting domain-containing protein [Candidatus Aegiribacteria sp.]